MVAPQAGITAAVSGRGGEEALPLAGMAAAIGGIGGDGGAAGTFAAVGAGAFAEPCDRGCLLHVMQVYLDALVAHDPSKLATSPALTMTDNGVPAQPGDGLWNTATLLAVGARLDFADPVTGNVATQCVIWEGSIPVIYGARLNVEAGLITEIESITVRREDAANGLFEPANLEPLPVFTRPPDPATRMTRDELLALQEVYLDYFEGDVNGRPVPFDESCTRYENGVVTDCGLPALRLQSRGLPVTRRVLIVDEEAGITFGMFPFMQTETALVAGQAFKMLHGKITMIQAIAAYMPSKAWN